MYARHAAVSFTTEELVLARRAWLDATATFLGELNDDRGGVFAEWSEETVDFVRGGTPLLMNACFDALEGDPEPLRRVMALVRTHGVTRARHHIALVTHLQVDVYTRSEILIRLAEIAGEVIPRDLNWRVTQAMIPFFDEVLVSHMLAYGEEAAALNAEQEDTIGFALRVSEAGFAHGELDGPITYANDRFADYFSHTSSEGPSGTTWETLLPAEAGPLLAEARNGQDAWRDIEVVDAFGATRLVRLSLHPVKDRLQALAIDVGDRVAYERRHAEFVRGVIHDLRAPLTLISGWSRTLLDSSDRLDPPTRGKALETINKAARQLATMTENLLELVVIESGTHVFASESVDLAALARTVGDVVGPDIEVDAPDPVMAVTDENAVSRIITNLVDNALTHGKPPLLLRAEAENGTVILEVCDRGVVDEAVVAAAFRSRVESSRGFGIGLRTAWLTAEALGGHLRLDSSEPTTFTLTLPTRTQNQPH